MNKISLEDLYLIRDLKSRAVVAAAQAEKALAEAKTVEYEARYGILTIYMKYGLKPGESIIAEDGTITSPENLKTQAPTTEDKTNE